MTGPLWVLRSSDWEWWEHLEPGTMVPGPYVRAEPTRYRRLHGVGDWRSRMRSGQLAYWLDTEQNLVYALQAISYRLDADPDEGGREAIHGTLLCMEPVLVRHPGQSWADVGCPTLNQAHMLVTPLYGQEAQTFIRLATWGVEGLG